MRASSPRLVLHYSVERSRAAPPRYLYYGPTQSGRSTASANRARTASLELVVAQTKPLGQVPLLQGIMQISRKQLRSKPGKVGHTPCGSVLVAPTQVSMHTLAFISHVRLKSQSFWDWQGRYCVRWQVLGLQLVCVHPSTAGSHSSSPPITLSPQTVRHWPLEQVCPLGHLAPSSILSLQLSSRLLQTSSGSGPHSPQAFFTPLSASPSQSSSKLLHCSGLQAGRHLPSLQVRLRQSASAIQERPSIQRRSRAGGMRCRGSAYFRSRYPRGTCRHLHTGPSRRVDTCLHGMRGFGNRHRLNKHRRLRRYRNIRGGMFLGSGRSRIRSVPRRLLPYPGSSPLARSRWWGTRSRAPTRLNCCRRWPHQRLWSVCQRAVTHLWFECLTSRFHPACQSGPRSSVRLGRVYRRYLEGRRFRWSWQRLGCWPRTAFPEGDYWRPGSRSGCRLRKSWSASQVPRRRRCQGVPPRWCRMAWRPSHRRHPRGQRPQSCCQNSP